MSTKRPKKEKLNKARQEELQKQLKYATAKSLGGIFVIAFLFYIWGSHLFPVTDPVESNYASTAKEMVLSGNWMSPQIYGHFWFDKPVMVYWLLSVSYTVLGFTDLAARIPAAFCGALTVTALVWYIRRITKDNVIAMWSGIILGSSLAFWIVSHAIITDSILMLFTVPTLLSAYIGLTENNKCHMTVAYTAAGLACLTKGPVGLVLPGLFLLCWCFWMQDKQYFLRLFPWQGILAFFAVVLPWYGGMYLIHGNSFINDFLGLHNILRATSSEHPKDNHFYYYLIIFPLSLLPWTGLFFYELKKQWKEKSPFYKFLTVWSLGTLLFYTLMATKYVTYTYIALVPSAVLAAFAVPEISAGKRTPGLLAAVPFFVLMAVLSAGSFFIPDGQWWVLYLVIAYSLWALLFRWNKNREKRLTIISTVTASAFLVVAMSGLPVYLRSRSSIDMAGYMQSLPGDHYFFDSYSASYPYYTGDNAKRITISNSDDALSKAGRDPRWNSKSPIPSITDEDFLKMETDRPVYIYVSDSNLEEMKKWSSGKQFVVDKKLPYGTVFKREP